MRRRSLASLFASGLIIVTIPIVVDSDAIAQQQETDPYSPVLVQSDLQDATRAMTIYDPNEDGFIDKTEQKSLSWQDEVSDFDLNRDGKLTHLEIALRYAKLRDDNGITQFDINNVKKFLQRHDSNRNGQLDPDEIADGGWPSDPEDYDKNGDGVLTSREMAVQFAFNRGLRREMGIEAVDQTGAMKYIRNFDKDNDKKLDEEEQAKARLPRPAKDFDEDDDGKMGMMELATMLAVHRRDAGLTKPDVFKIRKTFDQFDLNRDGTIEIDNEKVGESGPIMFPEPLKKHLIQYDGNQDGTITIKEMEEVVAGVRKERGYTEKGFTLAKAMMTRHDRNRSKFIEESELHDTAGPGQLPKSTLQRADLDGDKKIDFEELAKHLEKENS